MYDLPEVRPCTDALWSAIAHALIREGVDGVPAGLCRTDDNHAVWTDPDLLLAQTCGYPLTHALAGRVRYVATPCYTARGCTGADYCSLVVVRQDDAAAVERFRDRRAAINGRDSQSGHAAFRAMIAPFAGGSRFFSAVVETGAHVESVAAVRDGRADICTIDAVTHALLARHRPDALEGTAVIAETPSAPGLPLITSPARSDDDLARLRRALAAVAADKSLRPVFDALLISDFAVLSDDAYDRITDMEQACQDAGYPDLT